MLKISRPKPLIDKNALQAEINALAERSGASIESDTFRPELLKLFKDLYKDSRERAETWKRTRHWSPVALHVSPKAVDDPVQVGVGRAIDTDRRSAQEIADKHGGI